MKTLHQHIDDLIKGAILDIGNDNKRAAIGKLAAARGNLILAEEQAKEAARGK